MDSVYLKIFLISAYSWGFFESEPIFNLPGFGNIKSSKQYSGYVDAGDGRFLFYW